LKLEEANAQATDYAKSLSERYQLNGIRAFSVVALGFERVVWLELINHLTRDTSCKIQPKSNPTGKTMKTKLLPLLLFTFATNAFAALDTPTEDFTDNNDGTVTHKKTGLTWQRCSVGQTWTGSSCSGSSSKMKWQAAIATYGNATSCNEWRLPRIDELYSIAEHSTYNPAINSLIFPNIQTSHSFWSTSPSANNSHDAWVVDFSVGADNYTFIQDQLFGDENFIRLVRGGQSCLATLSNTPSSDFKDNGNGTVTHQKTGLMWQRCSIGQTWDGTGCVGYGSKMNYASASAQISSLGNYNDWRLPTVSELKTIVEYTKYNPSINNTIFSNVFSNDGYWNWWTSSLSDSYSVNGNVWVVDFFGGGDYFNNQNDSLFVRLVRDAKVDQIIPTTIDLSATLSQSTSRVKINENLTYTATAQNNGTGTANNSLLKIYLPPRNVSVVSMPSDCVTTGKSITCSLGNLTAGANASRAITVSYIKSGGASLSALILTDSEDINSANNVSRIVTAIKK
jgi:uncharacterized repeat protein (TIGR01451 family)